MPDLATGELILIAIVLLAVSAVVVVLVRWSLRVLGAEPKGLRADKDDKEPVEDGSTRASIADRDRTIERLREETAQGRLTFNELEERMENAESAKTLGELSQLTQDLPSESGSASRKP